MGPRAIACAGKFAFAADTMHGFNKMMGTYLHRNSAANGIINASNWRAADTVKLQDLEHWVYTANEVIDTRYLSVVRMSVDSSWAIDLTATPISAILGHDHAAEHQAGGQLPPVHRDQEQLDHPDLYQSEGRTMVAAPGASPFRRRCGTAAEVESAGMGWRDTSPGGAKWAEYESDAEASANSLLRSRQGDYVKRGTVAVHERTLDDLAPDALLAEEKAFDPNRDQEKIPSRSTVKTSVNPLAFLVGRVEVVLGDKADPARNKVVELDKYINTQKQLITSLTGGWPGLTNKASSPSIAGAGGRRLPLGKNGLASRSAMCSSNPRPPTSPSCGGGVSMASRSRAPARSWCRSLTRALLPWQDHAAFTADKQELNGFQVEQCRQQPWSVEKASGSITIKDARLSKAVIVDPNGMPAD